MMTIRPLLIVALALVGAATLLSPSTAAAADLPAEPPYCALADQHTHPPSFLNCVNDAAVLSYPGNPTTYTLGAPLRATFDVAVYDDGSARASYTIATEDLGRARIYEPGGPIEKTDWWYGYDGNTNCHDSFTSSAGGFPHTVTYTRLGGGDWPCSDNTSMRIDVALPVNVMTRDRYLLVWIDTNRAGSTEYGRDLMLKLPKQDITVEGTVLDRTGKAQPGITMTLSGTSDLAGPVTETATTDSDGDYQFRVLAGSYSVSADNEPQGQNGGSMSARTADDGSCAGTAVEHRCEFGALPIGRKVRANFTYTPCTASERRYKGKPITGCPIVFIPGFLGSRIVCDVGGQTLELWPNIPSFPRWGQMLLAPDGAANASNNGACTANARVPAGKEGLVATVAGASIYQTTIDFLDTEAGPRNWWAHPYDWRKSPELAVPSLDGLVDSVLKQTGSKRVVLYAHSMGGLVMRDYIEERAHQDKVIRIATAGTPYWGAPKSHFSFLEGDTDTPERGALDLLTEARDLQLLTQNLQGLFFLHPSAKLGSWLSLATGTGKFVSQGEAGEQRWIQALGGNPLLLARAKRWHDQHDGFPETDIDYKVLVGAGSPTVTGIAVRRSANLTDTADVTYGSGDGTVPLRSATQGASDGASSGKVAVHYVCGVGHVALPGDFEVQTRIRDFLVNGGPVTLLDNNCPFRGQAIKTFNVTLAAGNVVVDVPNPNSGRSTRAATATSLTLEQAVARGFIQLVQVDGQSTIVTDSRKPVTVRLRGKDIALQVQTLTPRGKGAAKHYVAGSGTVTIGTNGAVKKSGKPVRVAKPKAGKPVTRGVVTKRGKRLLVRLVAKAPNGVGVTTYRIGTNKPVRYRRPFFIAPKQLGSLLIASTDRFGAVERPHGVRR